VRSFSSGTDDVMFQWRTTSSLTEEELDRMDILLRDTLGYLQYLDVDNIAANGRMTVELERI
jgi:hypothetical protein